jgi:hypothetical protein
MPSTDAVRLAFGDGTALAGVMDDPFDSEPEVLYVTHEDSIPALCQAVARAARELGLDEALPELPARAQDVSYHIISARGGALMRSGLQRGSSGLAWLTAA